MFYSHTDITWNENQLILRGKKTDILVFEDPTVESMWRIQFEDGCTSVDYYNLTRAKNNAAKWVITEKNRALQLKGRI